MKKELSSFQREAEESDRVVNDFIKVEQRSPKKIVVMVVRERLIS